MNIELEQDALIVLIGAMGVGKSTFVSKVFNPWDIVSTDKLREELTGDFQSQKVNEAVFDILNATVLARAKMGLLTVVDSTGTGTVINHALKTAQEYKRPLYAFVFPALDEHEITPNRMQHRMRVLDIYHNQVARIARTQLPKSMKVIHIPKENRDEIRVTIKGKASHGSLDLDPSLSYIVMPDIHGDVKAIESVLDKIDEHTHLISLGDIVDRGPSSYRVFQYINGLRLKGLCHSVISNHDHKFYRWCKKYIANEQNPKSDVDTFTFGMQLANGLRGTVEEFYKLSKTDRDQYAKDFKEYFESCAPLLRLNKDGILHHFVHAGITVGGLLSNEKTLTEFDISSFMYASHTQFGDVQELLEEADALRSNKTQEIKYGLHVGHNFGYHQHVRDKFEVQENDELIYVQHDVGFGKKVYDIIPEFMEL